MVLNNIIKDFTEFIQTIAIVSIVIATFMILVSKLFLGVQLDGEMNALLNMLIGSIITIVGIKSSTALSNKLELPEEEQAVIEEDKVA
jgi:hypothetical protein